jgi:hypothetical protein
VKVETVIVETTVAVMAVAGVAREVIEEESVGIVVRVRKETDHEEETVVRVRKETDRRVHREIARRAHKAIGHRVRKETGHKESVDLVHLVPRAIDHRVHKESDRSVRHVQNRRPRHRLRWMQPLQPRQRHHHQMHQRLMLVPLRASRGRKPCYWHRHVQDIAASIVVA